MAISSAGRAARRTLLTVICASALLVACSGGSGGGGGGQTAGIEGTGIVSGFGSVYVNGIEFATGGADIMFNGAPADETRLRVGDVVTVSGRIDDQGNAIAERIMFDRVVDGPITRIGINNDGSGELVALDQTVRFDADTTFINTSAEALAVGDLIAISGFADDDAGLHATSIERGGAYDVGITRIDAQGTVSNLDAGSFRIGALRVRYDAARVDSDAGTLRDGAFVEVFGTRGADAEAPLDADAVTVRQRMLGGDSEQVFVEGTIARYAGLGDFTIDGQRIDASGARRTDNTGLDPAAGRTVSVRGKRDGDVVVADTLSVQPPPTYTLRAPLADVDAANNTLEVLNTGWNVQPDTLYLDRRDANPAGNDRRLRIGRLAAGDTVSVNGYTNDQGRIMTRLERIPADATGEVRARGPLDSILRDSDSAVLSVAGVRIVTRAATIFLDTAGEPIDADTFFASARGGVPIDARGPDNGGQVDTARVVQLLD